MTVSKHGTPATGDGRRGGPKPTKTQMSVRRKDGSIIWKATAKLFGIMGGKKS